MNELDSLFGTAPTTVTTQEPKLLEPGIYYNLPATEYHALPYISSTLLKRYAANPATARVPYKPGDDANVGTGIHSYSLQGLAGLDAECIFGPAFGKGKADLAEKAELIKANPTKTVLPTFYGSPAPGLPIMDVLRGVDASLRAHPKVGPILEKPQKEVSLVWIDEDSGCTCKARLDVWDGKIIWDLKKCKAISGFQWQIKDLRYDIQAGFYYEGAIACGLPAIAFGFIPCEAYPPYQVACGYVEPEKLEAARWNAKRLVGLVKQSKLTGYWPNFPIPEHIFDLNDIQPDDLMMVW